MKTVVNNGRWIVECPHCRSALVVKQFSATVEFPKFGCVECGYGMVGPKWEILKRAPINIRIKLYRDLADCMASEYELPPNVNEIEQALLRRLHPAWRNWLPGMTVQELIEAEPGLHFSWTAPRTWAIEIVTASMMNIHLRDNLLESAPAKAVAKGDLFAGSAANAIGRLPVGSNTLALVADASQSLGVKWGSAAGYVLQRVHYQIGTNSSGLTLIPYDNTIPQSTEGNQYMSLAITPLVASNYLYIETVFLGGASVAAFLTAALFMDATADALAVGAEYTNVGEIREIPFRHRMLAGTTSAIVFKVRAGINLAGTNYFNSSDANPYFGGQLASSITITETLP